MTDMVMVDGTKPVERHPRRASVVFSSPTGWHRSDGSSLSWRILVKDLLCSYSVQRVRV